MVYLSRPYHFKFFKGCLPQILPGPFLNTLTQMGLVKNANHFTVYFNEFLNHKSTGYRYTFLWWDCWSRGESIHLTIQTQKFDVNDRFVYAMFTPLLIGGNDKPYFLPINNPIHLCKLFVLVCNLSIVYFTKDAKITISFFYYTFGDTLLSFLMWRYVQHWVLLFQSLSWFYSFTAGSITLMPYMLQVFKVLLMGRWYCVYMYV